MVQSTCCCQLYCDINNLIYFGFSSNPLESKQGYKTRSGDVLVPTESVSHPVFIWLKKFRTLFALGFSCIFTFHLKPYSIRVTMAQICRLVPTCLTEFILAAAGEMILMPFESFINFADLKIIFQLTVASTFYPKY